MSLKRLLAFGIDYFGILFVSIVFILLMLFSSTLFIWGGALLISIILNRDSFRGRSIGKRLLYLRVIDYNTKEIASTTKCILRNLTLFLWPIEVIAILVNPSRRLGDYIARTQVIEDLNKDPLPSKQEILRVVLYVVTTSLCIFFPVLFIINRYPTARLLFEPIF